VPIDSSIAPLLMVTSRQLCVPIVSAKIGLGA
jgi:hypothetical protein